MKKLMILSVTASFLLLASLEIYSQAKPPAFYIDKGACPFECCVYRKWKTVKTTSAFALPNARSKSVGKFAADSNVVAVTGEVHSAPGRFVVRKRHGKYNPGDILWTYTYLGEGIVKIWFTRFGSMVRGTKSSWVMLHLRGKAVKLPNTVGERFCKRQSRPGGSKSKVEKAGLVGLTRVKISAAVMNVAVIVNNAANNSEAASRQPPSESRSFLPLLSIAL